MWEQRDTWEGGCYPFCIHFCRTAKKNNKDENAKMKEIESKGEARDYPAQDCGKIRLFLKYFKIFLGRQNFELN